MSKEKAPKPVENLVEVEHALTTAERFFETNSKVITIIFGSAVVIGPSSDGHTSVLFSSKRSESERADVCSRAIFRKRLF